MSLRIVFLGTSEFALPALRRLVESDYEIAGVYTQPDRPAGRGRHERPSPVKELALEYGLPVFQPPRISAPESVEALAALKPDVMVAAAYGQILRQPVLDVPPRGVLNIHPSLLPRYRGASPVAAAILAGDDETGVTIMLMVLALDEGPIVSQRRVSHRGKRHDRHAHGASRPRRGRPADGVAAGVRRRLAEAAAPGRVSRQLRFDGEERGRPHRLDAAGGADLAAGARLQSLARRLHAPGRRDPAHLGSMAADGG